MCFRSSSFPASSPNPFSLLKSREGERFFNLSSPLPSTSEGEGPGGEAEAL